MRSIKIFYRRHLRKIVDLFAVVFCVAAFWDRRKNAAFDLCEAIRRVKTVDEFIGWYDRMGLRPTIDDDKAVLPAWIALAEGVCNDVGYCELACEILKGKYEVILRGVAETWGGKSTEFILVYSNAGYVRLVNAVKPKVFMSTRDAGLSIYGEATKDYYYF